MTSKNKEAALDVLATALCRYVAAGGKVSCHDNQVTIEWTCGVGMLHRQLEEAAGRWPCVSTLHYDTSKNYQVGDVVYAPEATTFGLFTNDAYWGKHKVGVVAVPPTAADPRLHFRYEL